MRSTLTLSTTLGLAVLLACAQGEQAGQTDSTARDLTLAPTESTAALGDVPAATPSAPAPQPTQPAAQPPRVAPPAPRPAAPTSYTASAGVRLDAAVVDTLSSAKNRVGDAFTATIVDDVKDAAGHVVIPKGAVINGTITEVKPAPNPDTPGTLTLSVSSLTVRGTNYPLEASIDSIETVRQGRGVTTGDAAKVAGGAAAGAILGRVLGGNRKGTVIGGVVGAAVGTAVAVGSKDSDIVLPAGAHINLTLSKALTVRAS
jgi:glycine zipper 2TM protein